MEMTMIARIAVNKSNSVVQSYTIINGTVILKAAVDNERIAIRIRNRFMFDFIFVSSVAMRLSPLPLRIYGTEAVKINVAMTQTAHTFVISDRVLSE